MNNNVAIAILQEARGRFIKELEDIDRSIAQLRAKPQPTNENHADTTTPVEWATGVPTFPPLRRPYVRDPDYRAKINQITSELPATVAPGEFAGMEVFPALLHYLNRNHGGPVPMPQVLRDLQVGGVPTISKYASDLNGQGRKFLSITISQHRRAVVLDKEKDLVRLSNAVGSQPN